MAAGWFVAATLSERETVAEHNLRDQGFGTLLPKFFRPDDRKRGVALMPRIMFPGYLLVGFDPDVDRWGKINNTRGVYRLLVDSRMRPQRIQDCAMEELRARLDARGVLIDEETGTVMPKPPNLKGEVLEVTDKTSPFFSFSGICDMSADERVKVLIGLFGGRPTPVEFTRAQVRRASDAA